MVTETTKFFPGESVSSTSALASIQLRVFEDGRSDTCHAQTWGSRGRWANLGDMGIGQKPIKTLSEGPKW
jgi:hypothetical protein